MKEQTALLVSTEKDEKRVDALFGLLAEIFTTPTATRLTGDDGTASADLNFKATTQRMLRLMEISKTKERITKETEKALFKLTDAEKLAILSNLSLKAPLRHEYFEEMQRLFLKVKGEQAYRSIFGDKDPPPPPKWVNLWKGK